jgi:hypothetical protein
MSPRSITRLLRTLCFAWLATASWAAFATPKIAAGDNFGQALSLSGDDLVVGTPHAQVDAQPQAGAVYAFARDGLDWLPLQRITAEVPQHNQSFGNAVAVAGEWLAVGVESERRVLMFRRSVDRWLFSSSLSRPESEAFGSALALDGTTLLVGARSANGSLGEAYVYVRNDIMWLPQATLTSGNATPFQQFGNRVAIHGDVAAVIASGLGEAYVFRRTGTIWSAGVKLSQPGRAVAVRHSHVLLGDSTAPTGGISAGGAAYVFVPQGTSWSEATRLNSATPETQDGFGATVVLFGETTSLTAAIGVPQDDNPCCGGSEREDAGSVYIFTGNGSNWAQQARLFGVEERVGDAFGSALAADGSSLAIGAPFNDVRVVDEGSVSLRVRTGASWGADAIVLAPDAPSISPVGALVMNEDGVSHVPLVIADRDTPAQIIVTDAISSSAFFDNGELMVDGSDSERQLRLQPVTDANGVADIVVSADDEVATSTMAFRVTVQPVNDAPTVQLAASPSHLAGTSGLQIIDRFATLVGGPQNETAQRAILYNVRLIESSNEFVRNVAIDPAGNLSYRLLGASGNATFGVIGTDSGGTENGGENRSQEVRFTLSVAQDEPPPDTFDLSAGVSGEGSSVQVGQPLHYVASVRNVGPADVPAATLRLGSLTRSLQLGRWTCIAHSGSACPIGLGEGPLTLLLPMVAGTHWDFAVDAIVSHDDQFASLGVSISAPGETIVDNNTSVLERSIVATDPHIYGNGFE